MENKNYPEVLEIDYLLDKDHIERLKEIIGNVIFLKKDSSETLKNEGIEDPKEFLVSKCENICAEIDFGNVRNALKHVNAALEYFQYLR